MDAPDGSDQGSLVSYFWRGDVMRSRCVSELVMCGQLDVPAPSARLAADWQREIALRLALEPGDVEALPLARARMRWPQYSDCVDAVAKWTRALGLHDVLGRSDVALMACVGARYHHDGAQYGGAAFCNLFLSEDKGLDLHFSATGHRIALKRGTVVIFDTGQPHAVIDRHSTGFKSADFPPHQDRSLVFLTWELPIEDINVAQALGVKFDMDPGTAVGLDDEQVWFKGGPALVCPASGRWHRPSP
jgi:hypothetical protein